MQASWWYFFQPADCSAASIAALPLLSITLRSSGVSPPRIPYSAWSGYLSASPKHSRLTGQLEQTSLASRITVFLLYLFSSRSESSGLDWKNSLSASLVPNFVHEASSRQYVVSDSDIILSFYNIIDIKSTLYLKIPRFLRVFVCPYEAIMRPRPLCQDPWSLW